ncbi:MAG: class I SAM-dependent methyltransferase, partial [Methanobacterium sp.]
GMRVLEVGCGSGAFTDHISRAVGNNGEVYASDIQPEMLEQLKKKLMHFENRDIKNVTLIECDACNMPFQDNYFDLISMVAVLQEIPDKKKALLEIKRVLKPHGILAITEFILDPDYPLKSSTIKECENEGFFFDDVEGSFVNYTARFLKPDFDFEKLS